MFRSLQYRNFKLFFWGQFVSLTGSWMQQVALSWLVYRLTRDPWQLGLVGFLGQFPVFLLGLYAGLLVDRMDRRRLVLATQAAALVQASVLAALTLSHAIELWQIYLLAVVAGAINALDIPARQVMIGELVPAADRHNAIALNSTIVNGSRIVGPAVAGVVVGVWGEGVCFAANAASFLAVLAALLAMQWPRQPEPRAAGSAWHEIRSGVAYALAREPIRILLMLLAVNSVAGLPFLVLMPIFADEVLHAGSAGMGLLMAASGVGATVGSLILANRRRAEGLERIVVRSMVGFGFTLFAFSMSRSLAWSLVLMAGLGFGVMIQFAGVNTLLQELSDDRYRGRVMSFYSMMFMGASPIGNFLGGFAATHIGAPWTVAVGASLCLIVALRYVEYLPRLARVHGRGPKPALAGLE